MSYKLFLDDVRNPVHCITYMRGRFNNIQIYLQNEWVIARNYESFKNTIESMGLPEFISFDHDLIKEHYSKELHSPEAWEEYHTDENREYTGYDCAKWLVNYCMDNKKSIPPFTIHSMNPVGAAQIMNLLQAAEKWTKKSGDS